MVRGTVRALKISRGDSVSRSRAREFRCPVVQETVEIRLRRSGGFGRPNGYFVQCNQLDCQYVEENKPLPAPRRDVRRRDQSRRGGASGAQLLAPDVEDAQRARTTTVVSAPR